MKRIRRKFKSGGESFPLRPTPRCRRVSPSFRISIDCVSDDPELYSDEENNTKVNIANTFCPPTTPTHRRLGTSFSIPAPDYHQFHPLKRTRSKSISNYETDRNHIQKLRRLSRWKLVGNIIPLISACKSREKSSLTCDRVCRLNTRLLDAIVAHKNEDVESLLQKGASANATCRAGNVSACHAAASHNIGALSLLLQHGADRDRRDKFGRTPLHLAAWAGDNLAIAIILDFPTDLQTKLAAEGVSKGMERQINTLRTASVKSLIEVPCELNASTNMEQIWNHSIEHKCRKYMTHLPKFFSGWSPLHVASYSANHGSVRLLLAAGANPNTKDAMRQTPLDVAGAACYHYPSKVNMNEYVNTIQSLIEFGGKLDVVKSAPTNTALHTAVELCSVEAVQLLLAAGATIQAQNFEGNTPLHECVAKCYEKTLKVLAKHCSGNQSESIDVVNSSGHTVLHAAIFASWIPGVCIALEAGADVTFEATDGKTALHIAALKGELDILDELFYRAAQYGDIKKIVNYDNKRTEPPVFSAIRSGNLECVQAFLDVGAVLEMTFYIEPKSGKPIIPLSKFKQKTVNMILHATADVGSVQMLELLFNHDKNLEKLLCYKCLYLEAMIPVEFAAHLNNFETFSFLLQKTLQRYKIFIECYDHSRLLSIIAIQASESLFKELIRQIPNAVTKVKNMTTAKGKKNLTQKVKRQISENVYYPLHESAKQNNKKLVVQLLDNGADLSEIDQFGCTATSVVMNYVSNPLDFLEKVLDNYINLTSNEGNNGDCEIVIDYKILIPKSLETRKNQEQLRVLTTFLKTDNCRNRRKLLGHPLIESFLQLKWKTLSTFFYFIVFFYGLFVTSLSVFTISTFYYKDENYNKTTAENIVVPTYWDPSNWQYAVYVTLGIVLLQELSHLNLAFNTCPTTLFPNLLSGEVLTKLMGYIFAVMTCLFITTKSEMSIKHTDWQRYLAVATLVFTWMTYMILIAKTPRAGYYIQMFWKVTSKVFEIFSAFIILIIMFTCCFMILFQSHEPFDGPWAAFVKTVVMMTSEFDYSDTFPSTLASTLSTPLPWLRLVFVVFLILTAIVLMNLMTGVAVDDVQYLVHDGNLKRLEKQVVFLNKLEQSRQNSFFYMLGLYKWIDFENVPQKVHIKQVNKDNCQFSSRIKQAIINKAILNKEKLDQREKEAEPSKVELKLEKLTQEFLKEISELKSSLNISRSTS